jgi:hypothetical protein
MKWKKTSHRCPDSPRDVYVLVKNNDGNIQAVAHYANGDWRIKCGTCETYHNLKNVIYWSELCPIPD